MKPELAALPLALKELQAPSPPGRSVLSVYLDTGPARTNGPAYLFTFRDGCKALRLTTPFAQLHALDTVIVSAEHYLTTRFSPGKPGLALFVSSDGPLRVVDLPAAPDEEVCWDAQPHLAPLYAMLGEYERVAAVLIDKERARLFMVYLGQIESQQEIRDWVPGKQATGGWYGLAQTHYARRHEEYVVQHVRHTIAALLSMFHAHPFDRLLIGGPDEAVALLKQRLPRFLRSRLAGAINLEVIAGTNEVLRAVLAESATLEQQVELQDVRELLDTETSPYVAVGLDETLATLSDRRVRRLVVSDLFERPGRVCMICNRLLVEGDCCPVCNTPLVAVSDLREQLIARAQDQGALVEVVTGSAGERLMQRDGLGAWLRY
jgi:peptide subunit release factor 1 (eRF1)